MLGKKFNMQKSSLCNLTENQVKGVKIWKHMQKGRDFITLQIFQALYFHQKIDWLRICILDSKFYQIRGLVNWLKINKDILPALSKQLVGLCKEHAVLIGKCDELFQQGIEIL